MTGGLVLLIVGLLAFIPVVFVNMVMDKIDQGVDYDDIYKNGTVTEGVIVSISTNSNVSINNQNPIVVTFEYLVSGRARRGTTETLDETVVNNYQIGYRVEVRYKGSDAIIVGIKPYQFPEIVTNIFDFMFYIPIVFLVAGLILFMIAILHARKVIQLYKYGQVQDAELVSVSPKSGSQKLLKVFYKFETRGGDYQLGECITFKSPSLMDKQKSDRVKIFVSENDEKSCVVPEIESLRNHWDIEVD